MGHKTGLEDYYIIKNNRKMRFGYTTGSCAAAAAKGAAEILLGKQKIKEVPLMTPKGILLYLELLDIREEDGAVSCAVRKDAGDDPDTTDGILVFARVEKLKDSGESAQPSILLDGGEGVGPGDKAGIISESRGSGHKSGSKDHDTERGERDGGENISTKEN